MYFPDIYLTLILFQQFQIHDEHSDLKIFFHLLLLKLQFSQWHFFTTDLNFPCIPDFFLTSVEEGFSLIYSNPVWTPMVQSR